MESLMDDSFDEIIANMEMPEDPGPSSPKIMKMNKPDDDDEVVKSSSSSLTSSNISSLTSSSTNKVAAATTSSSKNAIQVNPNQKGNPLLKAITNIPWEFNNDIIPDYIVGANACVLFLSIRYHTLKPDYLSERLKKLGKKYELRILLVHVDVKDSQINGLKHLTRICLLADLTLMLAWSPEEAGKIIETYKMFENAPAEKIKERPESDSHQKIINSLTTIRSVNKTDAMQLMVNFGTLEKLIDVNESKLNSMHGLGPRKAQTLLKIFNEPFLR